MDPSSPEQARASSEPTVPDLPHGITAAVNGRVVVMTAPRGVTAGQIVDAVKILSEAGVEYDRYELRYLPSDAPANLRAPAGVDEDGLDGSPMPRWDFVSAVEDGHLSEHGRAHRAQNHAADPPAADEAPEPTEAQLAALDEFLAAGRADLEAHIAATVDGQAGLRDIIGDQQ